VRVVGVVVGVIETMERMFSLAGYPGINSFFIQSANKEEVV
jgi:hypothetical protein